MPNNESSPLENNNSAGVRLPHSGQMPTKQGGEQPVVEYGTPLDEAVRQELVKTPSTVEQGFQDAPFTDEEMAMIKQKRLADANRGNQPPFTPRDGETAQSSPSPETKESHKKRNAIIGGVAAAATAIVAAVALHGGSSKEGNETPQAGPKSQGVTAPVVPGQTGEANPSQSVTTTPETSPSVDGESILKSTTYHQYIQTHSQEQREALSESVTNKVDIPLSEWKSLPLNERATRTADYIEVGISNWCYDGIGTNTISDTVDETKSRLDAIKWSPYVTKDVMTAAGKGDKNALNKIETIRRTYECTIGGALDAHGNPGTQIKENLLGDMYVRPQNDIVNRPDYTTFNLPSWLNTDRVIADGGTINVMPASYIPIAAFDGIDIIPTDAAWTRGSQGMETPADIIVTPVKTSTDKVIPIFGYTSPAS